MFAQILLAAFLAAPPATWADPFAPVEMRLTRADFFDPPQPKAKPQPYLASTEGLEWWAVGEDWGRAVTEAAPVLATMSSRWNQRTIYSALQCHTLALLNAPGQTTETARKRLIAINLLATERLERAQITPLACDSWPVARIVSCLGLLPSAECTTDKDLALQVRAAERIAP